ncbi:hypothetical protein MMC16_005172 [Acarospora aff. strigata]|nr:hypothetical protein [Acarospora aff. strigata]
MSSRTFRARTEYSHSGSNSSDSDSSDRSRSTAPTLYSVRPGLQHFKTAGPKFGEYEEGFSPISSYSARSSVETYASTVSSDEELPVDFPPYDVPDESREAIGSSAVPSTPADFAHLFPSTRRLCIRHDDATLDGNMNLRVDTEAYTSEGRKLGLTLFHLRMHDLRRREFSLRRYCRDSGREVCHSGRKVAKATPGKRPTLHHSVTSALSSIRSKSESKTSTIGGTKRRDSGYSSTYDDDGDLGFSVPVDQSKDSVPLAKDTVRLEFSNYAHVDVKPRGTTAAKKYEFEFWGTKYAWKRVARKDGKNRELSYNLINVRTGKAVAYIVSDALTTAEADEEEGKGGWVPPCSMWISDEKLLSGVTDVAESVSRFNERVFGSTNTSQRRCRNRSHRPRR